MSDVILLLSVFGVMGGITGTISFILGYNFYHGDPEAYIKPKKGKGILFMAFSPLPMIAGILFPIFVLLINKG